MFKSIPNLGEIVSLGVMLLMVIALVAGQAGATIHQEARADSGYIKMTDEYEPHAPLRATIKAHIDGEPLTISIDASAEFDYFRLEDE